MSKWGTLTNAWGKAMTVRGMTWLAGWVTILAWLTAMMGIAASAQENSCYKPIEPCKACHSRTTARALAWCVSQPWVIPPSTKELKNPLPSSPETLDEGEGLYNINCKGCHGPKGEGMGPVAVKFALPSIDISTPTVQSQTEGELFWKISNGKGAMPAWNTILTDEDCWKLVTYIRTFRKQ